VLIHLPFPTVPSLRSIPPVPSPAPFPRSLPPLPSPHQYLFTDESGGTHIRTQIILIPCAGRLSSRFRPYFFQVQSALPQQSDRPSFRSRAVFLQLQDRLPPWPERPSSSSGTDYLRGQSDLPPDPGQTTSVARATILSSRTGYFHGQGDLPVNGYPHQLAIQMKMKQQYIANMIKLLSISVISYRASLSYSLYEASVWVGGWLRGMGSL
jgi:hypothetical protein